MKFKYIKNTSLLIVLVILLSFSIIPVSASSGYYESTYNGYNYNCRSELYSNELYGEMNYAGSSKISVEASYYFIDTIYMIPYYDIITSIPQTSYAGVAAHLMDPQLNFIDAYYIYNIGPNAVYTTGLIY